MAMSRRTFWPVLPAIVAALVVVGGSSSLRSMIMVMIMSMIVIMFVIMIMTFLIITTIHNIIIIFEIDWLRSAAVGTQLKVKPAKSNVPLCPLQTEGCSTHLRCCLVGVRRAIRARQPLSPRFALPLISLRIVHVIVTERLKASLTLL